MTEDSIDRLLAVGDVLGGHRTRQQAKTFVPVLKAKLGVPAADTTFDPALEDFIIDVILGAAWYARKYRSARTKTYWYIAANAALVLGVPAALYMVSRDAKAAATQISTTVAQLSGLLTGIFALQKMLSAWFSQQQRYAAWYQSSADLKQIYYDLLRQHPAAPTGQSPVGSSSLLDDLSAGADKARKIMNAEQLAFYQSLALPAMDVLDMLTGSSATVTKFVTSLVPASAPAPAATPVSFVTVGSKTVGAAASKASPATTDRVDSMTGVSHDVPSAMATIPAFDSKVVAACANQALANSTDLDQVFGAAGGFFAWYNRTLSSTSAFKHRGKARNDADINKHFTDFWDQISITFGTTPISLVEFCALMSVNVEETTGDLTAAPEEVNEMNHPHPGLAYAFDRISGLKQSYNHAPNKTALQLFSDADFVAAHRHLPGGQNILNRPGGIDPAWGGDTWPAGADARPDAAVNGFVMQADFYKFRGRGVIQTTWRDAYKEILRFLVADSLASEPDAKSIRDQWVASAGTRSGDAALEFVLTISTTQQWDTIFGCPLILAQGVHIDSSQKNNYLRLSHDVSVLSGDRTAIGSLMRMASTINGGDYPTRVVPMMKTMMSGVAELLGSVATS